MADTDAFFTPEPTTDYTLCRPRDAVRAGGEAGTLTFPSGYTTPHPENNTVYARYFPANPIRKPRNGKTPARRAVVVLAQWNSDADGHIGLCKLLSKLGIASLRISLPYHDRAHAAGADARRLHRQLERRPHAAGVPAGGAATCGARCGGCATRATSGSDCSAPASDRAWRC